MSAAIIGVLSAYEVSTPKSRAVPSNRVSRAEEKKDMVALSSKAKDFLTAKQAVNEVSDIRSDKVEAVMNRIKTNSYHVNGPMIADKLLEKL